MAHPMRLANYLVSLGFVCLSLLNASESISADTIIYGVNAYNRADIVEINLTNNTYQQVGDLLFDTQASDQDPITGFVYYFEWTDSGYRFAYWNPATGQNTIVRTYNPVPGLVVKRMAFAPDGTLYIMDNEDILHTIDPSTGDIASVGLVEGLQSAGPIHSGDMAFTPDGTLYLDMGDSLFTVDIETLTAMLLYTDMLPGSSMQVWTGLAYCDGLLYASDVQIGSGLYAISSIDPSTGFVNQLFATQTLLNDLTSCPASLSPPVNRPPTLDPIGEKIVLEGETLEFTVTASDPDGDNMTFAANMLPPGANFDPATQVFSWITTFGDHGVYPGVEVTVTDDDPNEPLSDTEAFTITVSETPINRPPILDPIGDMFVLEGETLEFTVTASDPDGDNMTFAANMLPPGANFDPATQVFSWITTFGDHGVYPGVEVTVTDDDPDEPLSDTEAFTITVSEEPVDVIVFVDSFESGLGNWMMDAQNDWFLSTQRSVDGSFSAEVDGRAIDAQLISIPINLQGKTNATITFSWFIETSLDRREYLAFDVSTDGGSTWVEQARLKGNVDQENLWHDVTVDLSDLTSLSLRFRGRMSRANEDADIDWIIITAR